MKRFFLMTINFILLLNFAMGCSKPKTAIVIEKNEITCEVVDPISGAINTFDMSIESDRLENFKY